MILPTVLCALFVGGARAASPAFVAAPVQTSVSAAGASFAPQFSADGQRLIFISHANNLVTNDDLAPWLDLFVRDLAASNTVLVSVNTSGTGGGNADANDPSVSSNGQFIAFVSRASNLVPGDTNDAPDVFVRDVVNGTTRLASVDVNGRSPIDPAPALNIPLSAHPMISGDGRWVFFESRATNLTATPSPLGSVNIYGRDLWSNVTALVTGSTNGTPVNGRCELAAITPDGKSAVFTATNDDLAMDHSDGRRDVFRRNLTAGSTEWISSAAIEPCGTAAVSDDGQVVFFTTSGSSNTVARHTQTGSRIISLFATNTPLSISADGTRAAFEMDGHAQLWIWNPDFNTAPEAIYLANRSAHPVLSRDGQTMAFVEATTPAATQWQIHLRTPSNNIVLVSASATGGPGGADFHHSSVAISGNGSLVAFDSAAGDLVAGDFNGASDVFLRDVSNGTTELISAALPARPSAVPNSRSTIGPGSISADGRFVVFTRHDDASDPYDTNGWSDVMLADTQTGAVRPVSVQTTFNVFDDSGATVGTTTTPNSNLYTAPILSADGSTVVALRVRSTIGSIPSYDIAAGRGSNGVFSDGLAGVSRDWRGYVRTAESPSVSGDGLLIAFQNAEWDFVDYNYYYDNNNASDVFVRYFKPLTNGLFAPTNYLVSGRGATFGNSTSAAPVISVDGRWIAFQSLADDLVIWPYASFPAMQMLLADLGTNRASTNYLKDIPIRLASYTMFAGEYRWMDANDTNIHHTNLNHVLTPLPQPVTNALFSGNQRYLVFSTGGGATYRHDLSRIHTNAVFWNYAPNGGDVTTNVIVAGAPNDLVCTNCRKPSVSADGNIVAFERVRSGGVVDLFATDLRGGGETLVSATLSGAPANGTSTTPLLSADGRYVVFQSKASDLVANDTNGFTDVFVRDRLLGVTLLASANAEGRTGNGPSTAPVLAADGRTVVFQSFANDLLPGDYNDRRDVFILKLGATDTDGDGMDDDWEVAYFGNLSQGRDGDFDGDNAGNRDEFLAGTDPTNGGSVFRAMTLAPLGGGTRHIIWSGNPSRSYRVEHKDDVNATAWTPLATGISWNGPVATATDSSAITNRFYRVRSP